MSEENNSTPAPNREQEWKNKLSEVNNFAQTHQKWPSTTSQDANEKRLAQWWSRQKYGLKQHERGNEPPGINNDRASAIRDLVNSHQSFERDGIWEERFNRVMTQIKQKGKLWSYNSENSEEKMVLRWWNQQKTFYRKFRMDQNAGGMTESRAKKIEELLTILGQSHAPTERVPQIDNAIAAVD